MKIKKLSSIIIIIFFLSNIFLLDDLFCTDFPTIDSFFNGKESLIAPDSKGEYVIWVKLTDVVIYNNLWLVYLNGLLKETNETITEIEKITTKEGFLGLQAGYISNKNLLLNLLFSAQFDKFLLTITIGFCYINEGFEFNVNLGLGFKLW